MTVPAKKQRERYLIDQFLAVTPDFDEYEFAFYDENPDLIYQRGGAQLGFESILVIPTHESRCRLDSATCELQLPLHANIKDNLLTTQLELSRTLFEHLRHYKLPTVIVFTILSPNIQLEQLAAHFALPEVAVHNIVDYFVTNGSRSLKIIKTRRV